MEREVFRLLRFEKDKEYETTTYTRQEREPKKRTRYFSMLSTTYVGKWVRTERTGYGDGGRVFEIFDDNGRQVIVEYNYEGTTCFVEAETVPYILK
jgi:hypothetical protein